MNVPLEGQVYKHRKGGHYDVVTLAMSEYDQKVQVVYRDCKSGKTWVRPIVEFQEPRFTLVK